MATGSASRFYAGLNRVDTPSRNVVLDSNPRRSDQVDILNLIKQQQEVTQELQLQNNELQHQNTALLVLTAKIDKEVKALRQDRFREAECSNGERIGCQFLISYHQP